MPRGRMHPFDKAGNIIAALEAGPPRGNWPEWIEAVILPEMRRLRSTCQIATFGGRVQPTPRDPDKPQPVVGHVAKRLRIEAAQRGDIEVSETIVPNTLDKHKDRVYVQSVLFEE